MKPFFTAAVAAFSLLCGTSAFAEEVDKRYEIGLFETFAVGETGSPAPEHDETCQRKYEAMQDMPMVGEYQINTKTFMMLATAVLPRFSQEGTILHPLGIEGVFAFMSTEIPPSLEKLGVERIILRVNEETLEAEEGDVMARGGENFSCVISNKKAM